MKTLYSTWPDREHRDPSRLLEQFSVKASLARRERWEQLSGYHLPKEKAISKQPLCVGVMRALP